MKKISQWMLIGVLACSLGTGLTACSDDDEDKTEKTDPRIVIEDGKTGVPDSLLTDEERYLLACKSAVSSVVRSLTDVDRVKLDEMTGTTHEPTYGMTLDGESPTVRVMKSRGTEDAEQMFSVIASLDNWAAARLLTPTPDGYTLSLKDLPILADGKKFSLGTLTFHRDGGPRRYGWVDVDIPCIPHLERIDYLGAEAFPDNANCPYQKGDVVYVSNEVTGYSGGYYLCVETNGHNSTLVHLCLGDGGGGYNIVNFDGDDKGCSVPWNGVKKNDKTTAQDIKDYVYFILENEDKVANIKTFLSGRALNKKPGYPGGLESLFPEGFNNDMGVAYINTWGDHDGGNIYYDAEYGDYAGVPPYDYRHPYYANVPHGCSSGSSVKFEKGQYVYDNDWKPGHQYYYMNAIHTESTPAGFMLDYSALNDPLYTKDTPPSDYTYYQFSVPSFEGAKWNSTLIKDVYVDDRWIAQVCQEYVPKINRKERITVVYPVYYDYPRYDKGFFPGDNIHKPAYVSWSDNGETVNTCDGMGVGQVPAVYVSGDKIVTEVPEDEWPYKTEDIRDEYLHGLRCNGPGGSNANSDYPLVKIFNRVWTREEYCQAFADIYNDGRSVTVTMDGQNVTVAREYYPFANFARASMFPKGWSVASATDFQNMYNILANNGHSQPGYALLNGGVTGFEVYFVGWYDYGLNTWANGNLHMEYATKDLWHVGIRSDNGAFVIQYPFNVTYWRMCIRLVKDY